MVSTANHGARGGGVTILGAGGSILIQMVSLIVLSRILSPDDFGLIAMVQVFISLGNLLRDFGIPTIALKKEELSHQQASNLFWLNSALALFVSISLSVLAPLIALFYGDGRLIEVIPVMAIALVINGMGAQLRVSLARRLKFGQLVISDLVAQCIGLGVAVLLGFLGVAYWALVGQTISAALALLLFRWVVAKWRPRRYRRGFGTRSLVRSGGEFGLAQFLWFVQNNASTLIIGRMLGAGSLGLFHRANQLVSLPLGKVLDPLTQVVVPILNRVKSGGGSYSSALIRIQFVILLGVVWMMSILYSTSDSIVPLLLGEEWSSAAPILEILAIGGSFHALGQVNSWALLVGSTSSSMLRFSVVTRPVSVLLVILGSTFGIEGAAWGYVLGVALAWVLGLVWIALGQNARVFGYIFQAVAILVAGVLGAYVVWLLDVLFIFGDFSRVLAGAAATGVVMVVLVWVLPWTRSDMIYSLRVVKGLLR